MLETQLRKVCGRMLLLLLLVLVVWIQGAQAANSQLGWSGNFGRRHPHGAVELERKCGGEVNCSYQKAKYTFNATDGRPIWRSG